MVCEADISAIEDDIKGYDGSIREQIYKKIEKVKENPEIGETKKFGASNAGMRAVKVHRQKIVMFYRQELDVDPCKVVFVLIDKHDRGYEGTYR